MIHVWRKLFKSNSIFFYPYLALLAAGIVIILFTKQAELHLFFNNYHNHFFDTIFFYITFLGDGVTATIISLLLLLIKYRYALVTGISCLIASAITQTLKHFVFSDALRPKKFFEGINELHLVSAVENYSFNSFPSGHTTIAFAICTSLVFFTPNKGTKLFLFFTAILIAYSRVYLSQHFFEDIYAGSIIGCLTSCGFYLLFDKANGSSQLNNSLLSLFKK